MIETQHSQSDERVAIPSSTRNGFIKPLILTLVITLSGLTAFSAWAKEPAIQIVYGSYYKYLQKFQAKVALDKPNFRLVMHEEQFDDRLNAINPVTIKTKPEGAVATLYTFSTGEPVESCTTPCDLHIDNASPYFAIALKPGHSPYPIMLSGQHADDEHPEIWLGINYFDMIKEARTCYNNFKNAPKVDGNAMPCLRVPPVMPPWAEESGHCNVLFDVTAKGRVIDAKTTSCTHDYYKEPSLQSLLWWAYTPKVERGVAVEEIGIPSKISFKLSDEDGNLIPEPTQ